MTSSVSSGRRGRIIGLVPQELTTDLFETVFNTVSFSRGSTAESRSRLYREHPPRAVASWDKRDNVAALNFPAG